MPELFDYAQTAEMLGISERKLRRLVRSGDVAHVKIGRHIRFTRTQVEDALLRFSRQSLPIVGRRS